jgi:hypothetical protein
MVVDELGNTLFVAVWRSDDEDGEARAFPPVDDDWIIQCKPT